MSEFIMEHMQINSTRTFIYTFIHSLVWFVLLRAWLIRLIIRNYELHLKSSDAKASKCCLIFSSKMTIFIRLLYVQLFHLMALKITYVWPLK